MPPTDSNVGHGYEAAATAAASAVVSEDRVEALSAPPFGRDVDEVGDGVETVAATASGGPVSASASPSTWFFSPYSLAKKAFGDIGFLVMSVPNRTVFGVVTEPRGPTTTAVHCGIDWLVPRLDQERRRRARIGEGVRHRYDWSAAIAGQGRPEVDPRGNRQFISIGGNTAQGEGMAEAWERVEVGGKGRAD